MTVVPALSQTLVEYGALMSGLAAIHTTVEGYVGRGHLKYVVMVLLCLLVFMWLRQRR